MIDEELKRYTELSEAESLFNNMKSEMKKYQKLAELAEADFLNVIKNKTYSEYLFIVGLCPKAKKWLSMVENEKIDKRKKYDEKESFDFLQNTLSEIFEDTEIRITKILSIGWDSYGYDLELPELFNDFEFLDGTPCGVAE